MKKILLISLVPISWIVIILLGIYTDYLDTHALLIFCILFLCPIGLVNYTLFKEEERKFNKGICPECNTNWKVKECHYEGGTDYVCSCGKHKLFTLQFYETK